MTALLRERPVAAAGPVVAAEPRGGQPHDGAGRDDDVEGDERDDRGGEETARADLDGTRPIEHRLHLREPDALAGDHSADPRRTAGRLERRLRDCGTIGGK